MNLKLFRDNTLGTVVRLLPRPTYKGRPIKQMHNEWLVVQEVRDATFLFQNRNTRHAAELGADNIQEFRSPNLLILRGQLILQDGQQTDFQPTAQGLADTEGLDALIERSQWGQARSVYDALKPHEGEMVTLRFPDKGGSKFGSEEVLLDKCTPHYITLRRPELVIELPEWARGHSGPRSFPKIPQKIASLPLQHIAIAEDVEHNRPLVMFDHSFWEQDS